MNSEHDKVDVMLQYKNKLKWLMSGRCIVFNVNTYCISYISSFHIVELFWVVHALQRVPCWLAHVTYLEASSEYHGSEARKVPSSETTMTASSGVKCNSVWKLFCKDSNVPRSQSIGFLTANGKAGNAAGIWQAAMLLWVDVSSIRKSCIRIWILQTVFYDTGTNKETNG